MSPELMLFEGTFFKNTKFLLRVRNKKMIVAEVVNARDMWNEVKSERYWAGATLNPPDPTQTP